MTISLSCYLQSHSELNSWEKLVRIKFQPKKMNDRFSLFNYFGKKERNKKKTLDEMKLEQLPTSVWWKDKWRTFDPFKTFNHISCPFGGRRALLCRIQKPLMRHHTFRLNMLNQLMFSIFYVQEPFKDAMSHTHCFPSRIVIFSIIKHFKSKRDLPKSVVTKTEINFTQKIHYLKPVLLLN